MRTDPIRWLYRELPGLVERGLLTEEAAEGLRRHYGPPREFSTRRLLLIVFGVLGSLLIGSGILLLLAHNWDRLGRPARAVLAFAPLIAAQALALWVAVRRPGSTALSEGSASLLSLAIVGCVSLISQTYNMAGDPQSLLVVWVVLTLPVAYLLDSRVAYALSWVGATWGWMLGPWPEYPAVLAAKYFVFLAAAAPFAVRLHREHRFEPRSALVGWTICGALSIALIRLAASPETGLLAPLYAGLLGAFFVLGLHGARPTRHGISAWRNPFHSFGALGSGLLLLLCSFVGFWDASPGWQPGGILSPVVAGTLSLGSTAAGVGLLRRRQWEQGFLACTPLVVGLGWAAASLYSIAQGIALLITIYALFIGVFVFARNIGRGDLGAANVGLLLVLGVLTVRFFDSEWSFVARGVAFILLGAGFLGINLWMLKKRGETSR